MSSTSPTVRSAQRARVFDAYRGRGKKNSNLWLVYSVKTGRDWVLSTDRQLIHWVYYLETAPTVKSFELVTPPVQGNRESRHRHSELDAVVVSVDGAIAHHKLQSREGTDSEVQTPRDPNAEIRTKHQIITDADLAPYAGLSMRWLKAIGYAAAIREQEHASTLIALSSITKRQQHGNVGEIESLLSGFDSAVVRGLLVRMSIEGAIDLDMTLGSFRSATPWCLRERDVLCP